MSSTGLAQVTQQGIPPAANAFGSHTSASIARDSRLNDPLELLNDFYPSVEVTYAKHENVRRRPDVDEPDWKLIAKPELGYRTNLGRHKFYLGYSGVYTFHQNLDNENAQSNNLALKLGLDITRHWDVDVFAGVGEGFEERGVSGARQYSSLRGNGYLSSPEEVGYRRYGADLAYGRKIGILTGVLGVERGEYGYKNEQLLRSVNTDNSRDRTHDSIHLDLNWYFSNQTALFGRLQRSDIDYEQAEADLDSKQTDYLIGLRMKPTAVLSGVAGVGRTKKVFAASRRETFDGGIYYANMTYRYSPFSSIQLAASRTVEEPGDELADFHQSDYVALGWTHSFTPRWSLNAYAKSNEDEFTIERDDQYFDWGAAINYVWRDWLTIGLYYGEVERDSNLSVYDYEDRYYGIRLRSDLRSLFRSSRQRDKKLERFLNTQRTRSTQKAR